MRSKREKTSARSRNGEGDEKNIQSNAASDLQDDGRWLWLGVDGGGTNTRAVLIDRAGEVRGEGRAEAANFHRVGLQTAANNIARAVERATSDAGVEPGAIVAGCLGLAGVGNIKHRRQMHAALKHALQIPHVMIETDARVAWAGATDMAPGVVIIAGTGSIAYGVNSYGDSARAGGWGPTMGDEGSGHYIGRRALEAVVSAWDHRAPPTSMTESVCRHFGVESPPELPAVIYEAPPRVMREIAQLSRIVVTAAAEGDAVARAILTDAAVELARAAVAVIERLKMQGETFRIAYVGGVFEAGELIVTPLREAIGLVAPHAFIAPPLYPPVIGAAKLALTHYIQKAQVIS